MWEIESEGMHGHVHADHDSGFIAFNVDAPVLTRAEARALALVLVDAGEHAGEDPAPRSRSAAA